MKAACTLMLGAALVLTTAMLVRAAEAKEQTLKGTVTCAKCDLGEADECATVIKVKDTIYWFDKASSKKYHAKICKKAMKGTVTGVVSTDGDKKVVKVSKVEYDE
jgi:hypothetical protein